MSHNGAVNVELAPNEKGFPYKTNEVVRLTFDAHRMLLRFSKGGTQCLAKVAMPPVDDEYRFAVFLGCKDDSVEILV